MLTLKTHFSFPIFITNYTRGSYFKTNERNFINIMFLVSNSPLYADIGPCVLFYSRSLYKIFKA